MDYNYNFGRAARPIIGPGEYMLDKRRGYTVLPPVLLLHMDGADDGTVFTDSASYGGAPHTITNNASSVLTKTGVKKFGSASAYFGGVDNVNYLTAPDHADFDFGLGDFTIDFWMKTASTDYTCMLNLLGSAGLCYSEIFCNYSLTGTVLCHAYRDGTSTFATTSGSNVCDDNWHHVAVVRYSGGLNIYVDGISRYNGAWAFNHEHVGIRIGDGAIYDPYTGYMDELRILNSAAWRAPFTPPTGAYS